jgi:general secretion pathway protein K
MAGRTELRIAGNLAVNAEADAAADGAVYQAIFHLSPGSAERWPLDGREHDIAVGDSRVGIRVEDEAARINPNLATPALLAALFQASGSDPLHARQLADAVGEWIGAPSNPVPQAVVLAEYRNAGRDYGPAGAPLESLDELGRVLGMTPALLAAVRPHLSLFSGAVPDAAHADPVVAAALAAAARGGAANPPIAGAAPRDAETARIVAVARGPGNAIVTRTAIVRIDARLPGGYAVLAWDAAAD